MYIMEKCCIDTIHAVRELEKATGTTWKYSGLKDAHAVTVQLVSSWSSIKNEMTLSKGKKCVRVKKVGVGKLVKGKTKGNVFVIRLRPECNVKEYIDGVLSELYCVPGIYGYQRFGTKRPITHVIGKLILKDSFDEALDVLLGEPTPWESPVAREIRKRYYSEGPKAYLDAPKYMDIERKVSLMLLNGYSPKYALKRLRIFDLFLNAFQAYIYNLALTSENEINRFNVTPGYNTWGLYREYFELNEVDRKSLKRYRIRGVHRLPCYNAQIRLHKLDGDVVLVFKLPRGYYATSVLREIVKGDPKNFS
ncbi:hypothetical protein EYM_04010 [Ignicoccus islandicus DSM 13165]|uniref:TRUD domain-containing protein n=1 Tax=Ignicoccus islandicus DSM 13165 TaxID=940295 RepID=A0A0U3E3I0_9CREN|nr:hypothetical protein EYM_04010 [Ignicoccus islandicus DSM 13165]